MIQKAEDLVGGRDDKSTDGRARCWQSGMCTAEVPEKSRHSHGIRGEPSEEAALNLRKTGRNFCKKQKILSTEDSCVF